MIKITNNKLNTEETIHETKQIHNIEKNTFKLTGITGCIDIWNSLLHYKYMYNAYIINPSPNSQH